ncbi:MAG: hypothetical protein WC592_00590 [Candidatus Omnitrophota bacterium]
MQKIRYEIDPYNRLVLDAPSAKSDLQKFRQVLDGRFKIGRNNNLSYHIKAPLAWRGCLPNQVTLKGEWSLSDSHELRLTLDKSSRETFGDRITLKGDISDVSDNSITFAVAATSKDGKQSAYNVSLGGSWKADENNRLTFYVKKEGARRDILTFGGVWEVNKNHELIYKYEKASLIKKKRQAHTLTFKGHWDIRDALRLSYALGGATDSTFNFKASAGMFKEGTIRYEIGIGLDACPDPVRRVVTLSGKWNLKKDVGLVFEMGFGNKRRRAIIFGADARITGKDTVSFRLRNAADNKDLGVELKLSHKILKGDGEIFFRALASRPESAVYAGAAWRW